MTQSSDLGPQSSFVSLPPYRVWETRTGSGTPVALVHGLSGSSRWWSRNVDALAKSHLVAAIDLVGFGRSQPFTMFPRTLPEFGEASALIARWLETFGEPVHLVGHSMGGLLSIRVAAERPDLVRSLVLVDAAGVPFELAPMEHLRSLRSQTFGLARIGTVLIPDVWRAGPTSVAVASARILLTDAREQLQRITAPTLLVWGDHDALVPLRYGEMMHELIPDSRLVVLEGASHVAMWDEPAGFNREVGAFLAEVERSPLTAGDGIFRWGLSGFVDGMAYRQSGGRRDLVLVHGLGMSSSYFAPLARELYSLGWNPVAPDLPGFGRSVDAPSAGPAEHAAQLASWADALGIRDAVWLGHSSGCHAVAHVASRRPDLVREAIALGPLWTREHFAPRMMAMFVLDVFRERWTLVPMVLRAYWRTGFRRWLGTYRRHFGDIASAPPPDMRMIIGERDPIPDRDVLGAFETTAGAHAANWSHPKELAARIGRPRASA